MRVGIAIDSWKLSTFERHLKKAGFAFQTSPGVVGTLLLIVEVPSPDVLVDVVHAANQEASRGKNRN